MLTRAFRRPRRGVTLIELLVVLIVGGIALGLVASISLHEQRMIEDLAQASAISGQLRDASSILPIDLRGLDPGAGDIRTGQAGDTAIELRATIGSAVVCDTAPRSLVLAPAGSGSGTFGSFRTSVRAGDTAWLYVPTDTSDEWRPFSIAYVSGAAAGGCVGAAPQLADSDRALRRMKIVLDAPPSLNGALGFPLRITRPMRYSLYRASNGLSYLGEKDWNDARRRFNIIQPVSGPFLAATFQTPAFRYLDSAGNALATPVADLSSVALIQVDLRAQTPGWVRALGAAATVGARGDSMSIVVLLHNRR